MASETVTECLAFVAQGLGAMKNGIISAVEINNKIMYSIFSVLAGVLSVMFSAVQLLIFLVYNIVVALIEFVFELVNFGRGLLILMWKILILFYNFLDLIFHAVESIISFAWSGGKWTASTVQISAKNLAENGLSTWKYFVVSVKELSDSILGGFITIGQIVKAALTFCWDNLLWCYDMISEILFYIDLFVRDIFKGLFVSCYEFMTNYIYNIPKEAYIGIACCCVLYITMLGIVNHLYSHGLTFPLFSIFHTNTTDEFAQNYDDYINEFSDDEFLTPDGYAGDQDDDDEESDDYTELSDDETEDEDAELEIDSSNDSNTASESEMSEINIQLPPPETHYNLRRSTTPARARTSNVSMNELEREIETEKEKRKCVVCQDRKKSVLIMPCKHLCLCVQCADHIARARIPRRRVCPLCRTKIKTIMNVYV